MQIRKFPASCLIIAAILIYSKYSTKRIKSFTPQKSIEFKPQQPFETGHSNINETHNEEVSQIVTRPIESNPHAILEPSRGLCFFSSMGSNKLISLQLARHLRIKQPGIIVLPALHAECFKSLSESIFGISKYDPITDVAYDNFGSVTLSLKHHADYISYEEMLQDIGGNFKNFGFEGPNDLGIFFSEQGYFRFVNKGLIAFKVLNVSMWRMPTYSGSFEAYPGVDLISVAEAKQRVSSDMAFVIDLNDSRENLPINLKGDYQNSFSNISNRKITHPLTNKKLLKEEVFKVVPKDREVIIMGTQPNDMRPFNLVGPLYANGQKKVSVVKDGLYGANNINAATPYSVAGIKLMTAKSALNEAKNYIILDSRNSRILSSYVFEGSFAVPYSFPSGMKRSDPFFQELHNGGKIIKPKLQVQNFINIEDLKILLKNKSLLLVAANEYDWSPVIMGLFLKEKLNANIFWLREGMDRIENMHQLGMVSGEDLERAGIVETDKEEGVEVQGKEEGQGKMIFLVRKSRLKNDLRPGRRF